MIVKTQYDPCKSFAFIGVEDSSIAQYVDSSIDSIRWGISHYWGAIDYKGEGVEVIPLVVNEGVLASPKGASDKVIVLTSSSEVLHVNRKSINWHDAKQDTDTHPQLLDYLSCHALDLQLRRESGYGYGDMRLKLEPAIYGSSSMMVIYEDPDNQLWLAKNETTLGQGETAEAKVGLSFDFDLRGYVLSFRKNGSKRVSSTFLGNSVKEATARLTEIAPSINFSRPLSEVFQNPDTIFDDFRPIDFDRDDIKQVIENADAKTNLESFSVPDLLDTAVALHRTWSQLRFNDGSAEKALQTRSQRTCRDFIAGRLPYTNPSTICEMLHSSLGNLNQCYRSAEHFLDGKSPENSITLC